MCRKSSTGNEHQNLDTNDSQTLIMKGEAGRLSSSISDFASARLVILEGVGAGKQRTLSQAGASIGRAEDNDLVLDSPHVSRQHALVQVREGRFEIEDLGSSNGVTVNGRRLQARAPLALSHGDTLRLGDQVIIFLDGSTHQDVAHLSTIRIDQARVQQEVDAMLTRCRTGSHADGRVNLSACERM